MDEATQNYDVFMHCLYFETGSRQFRIPIEMRNKRKQRHFTESTMIKMFIQDKKNLCVMNKPKRCTYGSVLHIIWILIEMSLKK